MANMKKNLPKIDMNALAEAAELALCRKSYSDYVEYVHRPKGDDRSRWVRARHLLYVCDKIQKFITVDTGHAIDILVLQMPPQHGKSMTVTETLPSWYLGRYPDNRVILASYNDDTAERFARRNKEKIRDFGKRVFDIAIGDIDRATEIEIEDHQGRMISRGIMAGITSNPAELIIIDDPVKNRQEADSETYRERQWDEWLNTLKTRLAPKGKVIIILTRWHEDDLAGRIIANEKNVEVINLPCEAENKDPLGRNPGDSLFPEIGKDNKWLSEFKEGYKTAEGSRAWQALFQGHPSNAEGGMIQRKWWKYYDKVPEYFDEIIQSWDCTFKDSDTSDYVVGQIWGRVEATYYFLDQIRDRMDIVSTINSVNKMTRKWPKAYQKLIEDKANGSAVISMLSRKLGGIIAVNPEGGKAARVSAVSPAIESGCVYIPNEKIAPWVGGFVEECSAFPTGAHDDQVDCMSQALNRLIYHKRSRRQKIENHVFNFSFERPKPSALGNGMKERVI